MKYFILILTCLLFSSNFTAQDEFKWAKQSIGPEPAVGMDLAADSEGNTYVVGDYGDAISFDDVQLNEQWSSMYITKYNPEGEALWARNISGSGSNHIRSVEVDSQDNVYVSGHYYHSNFATILDFGDIEIEGFLIGSIFLAKIDPDGNWEWVKTIHPNEADGSYTRALDMIVTEENNVVVVGEIQSPTLHIASEVFTLENQTRTFFFSSFNSDGDLNWFKQGGGFLEDIEISEDYQGDIIFSGQIRLNAGVTYEGDNSIASPNSSTYDILVGKLNSQGELQWWKTIDGLGFHMKPDGQGLDAEGNIYLAFQTSFPWIGLDGVQIPNLDTNHELWKLSSTGEFLWHKPLYSGVADFTSGNVFSDQIVTSPDGITYVLGRMESTSFVGGPVFGADTLGGQGLFEGYLAAYSPEGDLMDVVEFIFENQAGSLDNGELILNEQGYVCFTGSFKNILEVGEDVLDSQDITPNMFLICADPNQLFDFNVGVNDVESISENIRVYPNPTSDFIQVGALNSSHEQLRYYILDVQGRVHKSGVLISSSAYIPISDISNGLYTLILRSKDQQFSAKVSIVK